MICPLEIDETRYTNINLGVVPSTVDVEKLTMRAAKAGRQWNCGRSIETGI